MTTAVEVKERPILFSGPMVRAILDGRKTQTRRIIKTPVATVVGRDASGELSNDVPRPMPDWQREALIEKCPYGGPGDLLWVREAWGELHWTCVIGERGRQRTGVVYRAGPHPFESDKPHGWTEGKDKWRPSIHMRRKDSRITLEIIDLRVERVQDISAKDIIAEGVVLRSHDDHLLGKSPISAFDGCCYVDLLSLWAAGWEKVNGKGAWQRNDWVWVISFRRLEAA